MFKIIRLDYLEEAGGLSRRKESVFLEELHDQLSSLIKNPPQRREVLLGTFLAGGRRLGRPGRQGVAFSAISCSIREDFHQSQSNQMIKCQKSYL